MPNPIRGQREADHLDEQIPWMNYAVWAEDINDAHARVLKARYYGEITYIDECLGRILDAVEARGDADNTLICFFSDHGDHLGDHGAWQKESFFEPSCHIPFLLSWPGHLAAGAKRDELVCLTDLFGLATAAAGHVQTREGIDLLGMVAGAAKPRQRLVGYYGEPGKREFKVMVRQGPWKYIYLANGGREQLFDLDSDPMELRNLADAHDAGAKVARELRREAVAACRQAGAADALAGDDFRAFAFAARPRVRICQFKVPGVDRFPARPQDALQAYRAAKQ
jgi:choline-sulfatase